MAPNWRVVWSEDHEKRCLTHTKDGLELLKPEVRETKKYQHIKERFVLERYTEINGESDLVTQLSYEPIWTFEDRHGVYLPPRYDACKLIIEQLLENVRAAKNYTKYKDPDESPETQKQRIDDMEYQLFGNETPVGDALAYGSGVSVPSSYKKETIQ
jgi:hypothetical protein